MKKLSTFLSVMMAFAATASGSVTMSFSGGQLTDINGVPLQDGSLLQIICATNGSQDFGVPTENSFLGENEVLLFSFGLNSTGYDDPPIAGTFYRILQNQEINEIVQSGALLTLRWWPTLTTSSTAPGVGTFYGEANPLFLTDYSGTPNWVVPADGTNLIEFYYETESTGYGTISNQYGVANYQVIPEPSTYALGGVGLLGALVALRRRRRA